MNNKDYARIVRNIEFNKIKGKTTPVSDAWRDEKIILDKDDFFKAARRAGYDVKKEKGVWYEQAL